VLAARIVLVCFLLLCIGCAEELPLSGLPSFPKHWKNVPGQGTDSRVGQFTSTKSDIVIQYDIGRLAGECADVDSFPNRQWLKSGRLAGSTFQYLLDKDDTLYVTFSDEGPANFWAKVKDQTEIDYILELLARYRINLLGYTEDS